MSYVKDIEISNTVDDPAIVEDLSAVDLLAALLKEIRLLNERFEEVHRTTITKEDI